MHNVIINGTILNKRYTVKKCIFDKPETIIYLASDSQNENKSIIIKELCLKEQLDAEEQIKRSDELYKSAEALSHIESPYIAKVYECFTHENKDFIVMENIEGITLERLCGMNDNGLKEEDVVKWAKQICEALYSLENRPNPFVFEVLNPQHIMINIENNIKLVNFGLDHIYNKNQDYSIFSQNILEDKSQELNRFARTIYYLLTKKELTNILDLDELQVHKDLIHILKKCYDQKAYNVYNNFNLVKKDIDNIGVVKPETPIHPRRKGFFEKLGNRIDDALTVVFQQNLFVFAAELIVLILLIGGIWFLLRYEKPFIKKGPVVFALSSKGNLIAIDPKTKEILTKRFFPVKYNLMQSDESGKYLFCSINSRPMLDVVSTEKFKVINSIRLDSVPSYMLFIPNLRKLVLIHPFTNNLSVLSVPKDLSQEDINVEKLFSINNDIKNISYSKFNNLSYLPSSKFNTIRIIDLYANKKLLLYNTCNSQPSCISASEKTGRFYCANDFFNNITVYNAVISDNKNKENLKKYNKLAVTQNFAINDIGGTGALQMLLDKNERELYVLFTDSRSFSCIDLVNKKLKYSIKLTEKPVSMLFIDNYNLWILDASGNITSLNVYLKKISSSFKSPESIVDFIYVD